MLRPVDYANPPSGSLSLVYKPDTLQAHNFLTRELGFVKNLFEGWKFACPLPELALGYGFAENRSPQKPVQAPISILALDTFPRQMSAMLGFARDSQVPAVRHLGIQF